MDVVMVSNGGTYYKESPAETDPLAGNNVEQILKLRQRQLR